MTVFDEEGLKHEIANLNNQSQDPAIFSDYEKLSLINKKLNSLQNKLNEFLTIKQKLNSSIEMSEFLQELNDENLILEFNKDLQKLQNELNKLYINVLLNQEFDSLNAIVKIHSGAGGTEACDWAQMLFRMYKMWVEKNDYTLNIFDVVDGDEAGIKSITFSVEGQNAYGYLKGENGVHRLVRISPFDSNKRRHTSFASIEVMPEIENDNDIAISPNDIRIDTFRASGAGGQHVNKTESAIRITHFPTGIVVTCQNERSQIKNRETAMKILKSKLLQLKQQENQNFINDIKGEKKKIEWGSQIRSYVFCPYTMVKDHRTDYETSNIDLVMDGYIDDFIIAYLKWLKD